jgi:hypothetical protein
LKNIFLNNTCKISLLPVNLSNANERVKPLLEAAKKHSGMVANMYENMANLPALLEIYGIGYNLLRKEDGFTPAKQEVEFQLKP